MFLKSAVIIFQGEGDAAGDVGRAPQEARLGRQVLEGGQEEDGGGARHFEVSY